MESPPPFTVSPPTTQKTSTWPKTLGIIAIIFGVGGLLQGIIGPISLLMVTPQMNAFVELGASQEKVDEYLAKVTQLTYAGVVAYAVLGILLLAGGIMLLKRRKAGPPILQIWAFLKIVIGGFLLFKSTSLTRMQMDIMFTSDTLPAGQEADLIGSITQYATWAGLVFGFVWLAALPVFMLIWLNRSKIRGDIATW